MPALLVRALTEETVAALKRRAQRHRRSLQKELRRIIEEAAKEAPAARPLPPIALHMSKARHRASWRREEIYGDDGR